MINVDMRLYDYFTLGKINAYGQPIIPGADAEPEGQIKIAIYETSQSIQDNIKYKDSTYVGLTKAEVKDTYLINYEGKRLKVLYVSPRGRYKQVFLKEA